MIDPFEDWEAREISELRDEIKRLKKLLLRAADVLLESCYPYKEDDRFIVELRKAAQ